MVDICDPAVTAHCIPTLENGGIIVEHEYNYAYFRLLANMMLTMYSSWLMVIQFSLFWGDILDIIDDY